MPELMVPSEPGSRDPMYNLLAHHKEIVANQKYVLHQRDDGTKDVSTVYSTTVRGPGDKFYMIPTVYDGKIVGQKEAIDRAMKKGWGFWPSSKDPRELDKQYEATVHPMMAEDVKKIIGDR